MTPRSSVAAAQIESARADHDLRSPQQRYADRIGPRASSVNLRARLVERETANLAEAFERFAQDDELVEGAALVVAARRRFIAGFGRSSAYATLLAWDLTTGLSQVTHIDGATIRPLDVLTETRATDVLVAFSFRRYHRQTIALAEQFAAAGGVVVAITDADDAPLAAIAQRTLIVPTSSASYSDSPTAVAAISHLLSALTTASAKGARRRIAERERLGALLHDYVD